MDPLAPFAPHPLPQTTLAACVDTLQLRARWDRLDLLVARVLALKPTLARRLPTITAKCR